MKTPNAKLKTADAELKTPVDKIISANAKAKPAVVLAESEDLAGYLPGLVPELLI